MRVFGRRTWADSPFQYLYRTLAAEAATLPPLGLKVESARVFVQPLAALFVAAAFFSWENALAPCVLS